MSGRMFDFDLTSVFLGCDSGLGVGAWCADGDGRRGSRDVVGAANVC